MKTLFKTIRIFSLLFSIWLLAPSQAMAQKESCKKCEFIKCIKNTIKQKEALRAGYAELARKWEKIWVNADAQPPVPLNSIDMEALNQASRIPTFAQLKTHFIMLRNQEEEMASGVGAPQGCGYDPSQNYEMETDSIFCNINMAKARQAQEAAPCQEIGEIAFRHEAMHLQRCQQRKGEKKLPTVVLTPAGKAREEMEAYTQEIAELKKLLEDIPGNSLELNGWNELTAPYVGTIVINLSGKMPFSVQEEPPYAITGSGSYTVSADTSRSQCRYSGVDNTYPLTLSGNKSGEILNFKFSPSGTQVIPGMRLTCPRGFSFSAPFPRMAVEFQIANKDGEKINVVDVAQRTGGRVKGENTLTLHTCPEDK